MFTPRLTGESRGNPSPAPQKHDPGPRWREAKALESVESGGGCYIFMHIYNPPPDLHKLFGQKPLATAVERVEHDGALRIAHCRDSAVAAMPVAARVVGCYRVGSKRRRPWVASYVGQLQVGRRSCSHCKRVQRWPPAPPP